LRRIRNRHYSPLTGRSIFSNEDNSIHTTSGTAITGFYSGQTTNNFDQPGAKLGNTGQTMVPSIPEPETYAMMLAGLGLMGFVARRRKQKAA